MNVTILGASGFVGRHLSAALEARGDTVRTASVRDAGAAARVCDGSDAVVNLAGEPVAQRWTPDTRARIRASRVDAARALIGALSVVERPPSAYISASAIGYYGTSESATFDETSGSGNGFLAEVCVAWEAVADEARTFGMRVAQVRTGLALGTDGGALPKLLPAFRLGVGGVVATGCQWYSWIHIDDLVGIYLHALDGTGGVLDATAPNPVTNRAFTKALGTALHRMTIFPVPAFVLQAALGDAASVITEGQRVLPERTLATGYRFRYETIESAFADLVG